LEDTRTFTGYIARLVALTIALVLFGLAIWFVVRLISNDNGEVAVSDDNTTTITEEETGTVVTKDDVSGEGFIDSIIDENTTVTITSNDTQESLLAATSDELEGASESQNVLAANTGDELPNTGPQDTLLLSASIVLAYLAAKRFMLSRRLLLKV